MVPLAKAWTPPLLDSYPPGETGTAGSGIGVEDPSERWRISRDRGLDSAPDPLLA